MVSWKVDAMGMEYEYRILPGGLGHLVYVKNTITGEICVTDTKKLVMEIVVTVGRIIYENIVNGFTIFTADDGFQTFTAKGRQVGLAPDIVLRLKVNLKNGRYGKGIFDQWEVPTELKWYSLDKLLKDCTHSIN